MSNEGCDERSKDETNHIYLPTGQGVPDIWPKIFQYLDNPLDMANLLFAFRQYFDPLLENYKETILFPTVLEILCKKDFLPTCDVLNCRLLSSHIKSLIDSVIRVGNPCFENLDGPNHDTFDPNHDKSKCWRHSKIFPKYQATYQFIDGKLNSSVYTPNGLSPFLLGVINFSAPENDFMFPRMTRVFRNLITAFGSQIHHFSFSWFRKNSPAAYQLLQEFLLLMPNLRTLKLQTMCGLQSENGNELDHLLQTLPLPDLHIVKFTAKVWPHKILNSLLAKYLQRIEKLELKFYFDTLDSFMSDYGRNLIRTCQNLKQISLPFQSDRMYSGWPATIDSVTINMNFCRISYGIVDLYRALHSGFGKAENVKTLVLRMTDEDEEPYHQMRPKTGSLRYRPCNWLELPSIKKLWIHTTLNSFNSIDFIAGLSKTLEELTIILERKLPKKKLTERSEIRFVGYWDKMYESNIWEVMPKLEHFTIRFRNMWREDIPWQSWEYSRQHVTSQAVGASEVAIYKCLDSSK